jgi:hypothetical protein
MATRTKRTYNLRPETISQVRELSAHYGSASSQDGVVELAVERLYREVLEQQEAALWASATEDPAFREEARAVARDIDAGDWPA